MGVKGEGWKRIIIAIFPIYFILFIKWIVDETGEGDNVLSFLLVLFIWVFGIKTITKIITWISEGFKKN